MNQIKKIIREPLLLFILAGVMLFIGYQSFNNYLNKEENVIVISKSEIFLLEKSFEKQYNRPPSPEEKDAIMQNTIKEMVLYKTALEMGLDIDDQVIRRRMVQKVEFLGNDLIRPPQPSEQDLLTFYEKHKEQYIPEERITITHIFFNPDKHQDATLKDADKALQVLSSKSEFDGDVSGYGDAFMLQNYYSGKSKLEVRNLFGNGFTESVFQLEPGKWHGPVLSGYGTHLVYVHHLEKGKLPVLSAVREQVKTDWMADMQKKLNDKYIEELMSRYEVVFEENNLE